MDGASSGSSRNGGSPQLFSVSSNEPRRQEWLVLVLDLEGQGEIADTRLAATTRRSAITSPAIAAFIVDQVVGRELWASAGIDLRDKDNVVRSESRICVGVERVIQIAKQRLHAFF
jgi:hypothetical protein